MGRKPKVCAVPPAGKQPLEAAVKMRLRANLAALDAYQFWAVQMGMGAATVDCLACVPIVIRLEDVGRTLGLFVAAECKRPGIDEPTARQSTVLDQVRAAGGVALLVNDPTMTARQLADRCVPGPGESGKTAGQGGVGELLQRTAVTLRALLSAIPGEQTRSMFAVEIEDLFREPPESIEAALFRGVVLCASVRSWLSFRSDAVDRLLMELQAAVETPNAV